VLAIQLVFVMKLKTIKSNISIEQKIVVYTVNIENFTFIASNLISKTLFTHARRGARGNAIPNNDINPN
jgi:hypothetical protein